MLDKQTIKEQFKQEICEREKEIDPNEELDWFSMSIGYFIAKGLSVQDAFNLASEVRYVDEYFTNE